MPNSVELLFKFITSGVADVEKAAAAADKLTTGAAKASAPVDALGKSLDRANKEAAATAKGLEGLADKIRNSLNNPLQVAGASAEGFASKLGAIGIVSGAVVGGLGAIGTQAFNLVAAMGAASEVTLNLADRLALTSGQTERLQAMAQIAGVNIGSLEGAARTLNLALEDSAGQGARAAAGLRGIGVSTREMNGELRSAGAVLLETLEKLSKIESNSERTFRALQVLPKGAALELLPLVKNFGDLDRLVRSVGVGVEDGLTQKLANADDAIGKVELAVNRLKRSLAGRIGADIVVDVSGKLADFIAGPQREPGLQKPNLAAENADFFKNNPDLRLINASGRRDAAAESFRLRESQGPDGQKAKLAELDKSIADLLGAVTESIDDDARRVKESALRLARSEKAAIESSLREAANRQALIARLPEMQRKAELGALPPIGRILGEREDFGAKVGPGFDKQVNGIFTPQIEGELKRLKLFAQTELAKMADDALHFVEKLNRARESEASKYSHGLSETIAKDERELDAIQRRLDVIANADASALTRKAQGAVKLAGAAAKPGDELALVQFEFETRERLAEDLFQIAAHRADLEKNTADRNIALDRARADRRKETDDAEFDRAVRLIELSKQRTEEARSLASEFVGFYPIWQAWDFLKNQGGKLLNRAGANVLAPIFESGSSSLGRIGAAIPGGEKIFEGTIFDPKNQKPLDKNTVALDAVSLNLDKLRRTLGGGGGSGGAGVSDLIRGSVPGMGVDVRVADFISDRNGIAGGGNTALDRIFSGKAFSSAGGFFGGVGSVPGGLFKGLGGDFSIQTGDGSAKAAGTAGRIGNIAGSSAAVAAGVAGVIAGLKEGGARGATTSIGSVLGVASMIPGPQQPFIMTAAAVAGLIEGLIPSGKETFDRDQNNILNSRKFTAPESMDRAYDFATGGDSIDADYRGRTRVIVQRTVQLTVNAMDARSVIDRGADIAEAVSKQMDAGHPVGVSVQKVIFGT